MKFSTFILMLLLLVTPITSFGATPTDCTNIYVHRSGPMPYGGDIQDQIDFILENIGVNSADAKKMNTRILRIRASNVRYINPETGCLEEYTVANFNNNSFYYHFSSNKSEYRQMKNKMRTLLKDAWGTELELRRI